MIETGFENNTLATEIELKQDDPEICHFGTTQLRRTHLQHAWAVARAGQRTGRVVGDHGDVFDLLCHLITPPRRSSSAGRGWRLLLCLHQTILTVRKFSAPAAFGHGVRAVIGQLHPYGAFNGRAKRLVVHTREFPVRNQQPNGLIQLCLVSHGWRV